MHELIERLEDAAEQAGRTGIAGAWGNLLREAATFIRDKLASKCAGCDGYECTDGCAYPGSAALRSKQEPAGEPQTVTYTNWRGETDSREIVPKTLWFGSTEWHPEPQWFITAADTGKGVQRDFALAGFASPPAPAGKVKGLRLDTAPWWVPWEGAEAIIDQDDNVVAWTASGEIAKTAVRSALEPSASSETVGWRTMDSAPKGQPSENAGCRGSSEWFLARPAKKYRDVGTAPMVVIKRRPWPQDDSWADNGETFYKPDYFDGWMPLPASPSTEGGR